MNSSTNSHRSHSSISSIPNRSRDRRIGDTTSNSNSQSSRVGHHPVSSTNNIRPTTTSNHNSVHVSRRRGRERTVTSSSTPGGQSSRRTIHTKTSSRTRRGGERDSTGKTVSRASNALDSQRCRASSTTALEHNSARRRGNVETVHQNSHRTSRREGMTNPTTNSPDNHDEPGTGSQSRRSGEAHRRSNNTARRRSNRVRSISDSETRGGRESGRESHSTTEATDTSNRHNAKSKRTTLR